MTNHVEPEFDCGDVVEAIDGFVGEIDGMYFSDGEWLYDVHALGRRSRYSEIEIELASPEAWQGD